MEQYEVLITEDAYADLEQLYNHIAYKIMAPENAAGQFNRIADAILTLGTFPARYPIIAAEPMHSKGMRSMPVDNYLVFYYIKSEKIIVTDVLFGASDISKHLEY
jgi:plasmid stabilization system protein ParE